MIDRIPPHNLEDEQCVLGAMMLDKEAAEAGLEALNVEDFYEPNHGLTFSTISSLYAQNKSIDAISVASELSRLNRLKGVGGAGTITRMVELCPSPSNVKQYTESVKNYSGLRRIIHQCDVATKEAYEHERDSTEILEKIEKEIYALAERETSSGLERVSTTLYEVVENIEAVRKQGGAVTGVSTGLPSLDRCTSGLQPGNMVTLAARPGVGKTSLALDIARHLAVNNGTPVFFFSLEMTRNELVMRTLSATANIPLFNLKNGFFSDMKWPQINEASERIHAAPLYMDCSSSKISPLTIRSACRRHAASLIREGKKLGLIVIDYLQLISSGGKYDSRQTEVSDISRSVKQLAMDLSVPVLALSQLNRQVEERGGAPRLSDLRESGSIEQDSDIVLFLSRDLKSISGETELHIAKHRNGGLGKINLIFDREYARFTEVTPLIEEATVNVEATRNTRESGKDHTLLL